jgi:hypothetical protein
VALVAVELVDMVMALLLRLLAQQILAVAVVVGVIT